MLYDANKKSMGVAYLLLLFFGSFGAHRFYMSKTGSAIAMLVLTLLTITTWWFGLGLITSLVVGLWVFVDIFLTAGWVRGYNNALIARLNSGVIAPA
jgi:TM2 domain-containing membrane protein YozV